MLVHPFATILFAVPLWLFGCYVAEQLEQCPNSRATRDLPPAVMGRVSGTGGAGDGASRV